MVNYVKVTNRKTFQKKILPELNSKNHTPSPTVWFLRNCGIAQNLSFAKAEKGNFARNDFCEWLRKLFFFRAKKEKFWVLFRKNCAKVLRMETLCRIKPTWVGNPSLKNLKACPFTNHNCHKILKGNFQNFQRNCQFLFL